MKSFLILLSLSASVLAFGQERIRDNAFKPPITVTPYLVEIVDDDQHIGNGAIVTTKHVLTSAILVEKYVNNVSKLKVMAGQAKPLVKADFYSVKSVKLHENYAVGQGGIVSYNIAVVEMVKAFVFSKKINSVAMLEKDTVLQWKDACEGLSFADEQGKPMKATMALVKATSAEMCKAAYPVVSTSVCTVDESFGHCNVRDSGGPLTCRTGSSYGLAGLYIPSPGCGVTARLYVSIASVREWIDKNTE